MAVTEQVHNLSGPAGCNLVITDSSSLYQRRSRTAEHPVSELEHGLVVYCWWGAVAVAVISAVLNNRQHVMRNWLKQQAPVCLICSNTVCNGWVLFTSINGGGVNLPGIPTAPYILRVPSTVNTFTFIGSTQYAVQVTCWADGGRQQLSRFGKCKWLFLQGTKAVSSHSGHRYSSGPSGCDLCE